MMPKPKYIIILTGLFCSVVAGCTSHFFSFFSVNILARVDFLVWQHWPLAWHAKLRPKTGFFISVSLLHWSKLIKKNSSHLRTNIFLPRWTPFWKGFVVQDCKMASPRTRYSPPLHPHPRSLRKKLNKGQNFNSSNTFENMKISGHGYFELMSFNHSARSGGKIGIFSHIFDSL